MAVHGLTRLEVHLVRLSRLIGIWILVGVLTAGAGAEAATAPLIPASPSESGVQVGGFFVQPAVDLMVRLGIITGDPDGRMRLHDTITRAELAKVVVVAMGQNEAAVKALTDAPAFPDVKDHWSRGYVSLAKKQGISGGYEDGSFRPGNPVTHAEALTMLLRASGQKPMGAWPQSYLDAARKVGVLTGPLDLALVPQAKATRAAVFVLAERIFTQISDTTGKSLLQRVFGQTGETGHIGLYAKGVEAGATALAEVTVTISAPGAVMVQVNGRPAWPSGQVFVAVVPLQVGGNELYIVAADDLGGRRTERLSIRRR